jgi:putative lipoic acid-binding regulatory protein
VIDALEIGARVLDREATGAEVEAIRRELERASTEAEHSFAERARTISESLEKQFERFLGEEGGAMGKVLEAHADELAELVARHFGGDRSTAVQHQVRELVVKALGESRQDLIRQFSSEDGHNPLADFKAAVVREVKRSGESQEKLIEKLTRLEGEVKRLRDAREAEAELAAERERGTGKGRAFEQQVFELVEALAAARGDVAHHVGDERSASGGKQGDIVIEIDAAAGSAKARIAIEAKDEKLSKNRAWETLNAALAERDAGFAILVVASDEKVPAGREPLHEYEGNKMIVTLDREMLDARALELAYRYARCRCLMSAERELALDAAGVRDAAEEALSALREAQKVRSSLTGASNSVKAAHETLDAMVARVRASLERVESLVAPS